ncbi:hypothetical protein PHLGIDRAFT_326849, partial [Phlebiopsis gigantea 11061_1 CR5-6]
MSKTSESSLLSVYGPYNSPFFAQGRQRRTGHPFFANSWLPAGASLFSLWAVRGVHAAVCLSSNMRVVSAVRGDVRSRDTQGRRISKVLTRPRCSVMGATGTGKSTFINLVSGSAFPVGEGLLSCTPEVQTSPPFELDGHRVTLIDTPGFDDTLKTDTEILKLISTFLADSYRADTKLSGIVYMHRISDVRAGGISRRNFALLRALCGNAPLRNVVVATNMWGEVDAARGAQREAELAADPLFFQPALARGAR